MSEYHQGLEKAATFICGHPKSGTSLILTLLDSHPQLIVYPEESHFFRRFNDQAVDLEIEDEKLLAQELILHIFTWNQDAPPPSQAGFPDRDYSNVDYERVCAAFAQFLVDSGNEHHQVLSSAILAYGEVTRQLSPLSRRWVEKTPYNENFAEDIFSWWPEAKCIHVMRDPRDNYTSYRRKQPDWSATSFARSWHQSAQAGWRNQEHYGEDRYLIMRYEDLLEQPEQSIAAICKFLCISDDPILRRPTRSGQIWGGNSMFDERFDGISRNPIGRYKDRLSQEDIATLEAALFPDMERFGYVLENPVDANLRLRWLASRLRWVRQRIHATRTN